jgi:hypothetical protein
LPSDILASVTLGAVTNARASEDDFPQTDNRWNLGFTGMYYGAFDIRPFYDDFWTTPYQPGSTYTANETWVEVSALISVLSTGPVGISDGVGLTNASLVSVTCMTDGTLLKPSVPAAAIDATFAQAAGAAPKGEIWAAPSYIPLSRAAAGQPRAGTLDAPTPYPFMTVLAIDVAAPFALYPSDLTPDLSAGVGPGSNVTGYVYVPWSPGFARLQRVCGDGQPAPGCATPFSAAAPITVLTGGERPDRSKPHEVYSLAPVWANGYALLGELVKATRVAVQRFPWVAADPAAPALAFGVTGASGEALNVTVVAGSVVRTVPLQFPANGGAQSSVVVRCIGLGAAATCAVSPSKR